MGLEPINNELSRFGEIRKNVLTATSVEARPTGENRRFLVYPLPVRTALLTNFIPPYLLPVLRVFRDSVESFHAFVSTPMEDDRPWESVWDGIDVTLQRSIATRHFRKFKEGFSETIVRHFPYDTLPLLFRYRPDVVVSAQLGFRTIQAAAYCRMRKSCGLVIWADLSQHTERIIGPSQAGIRRSLLRLADAVVVTGRSGSQYIQRLGVPPERIVLAPYVSNVTLAGGLAAPQDSCQARRLLYVGQLIERKGLELFFRALARWGSEHPNQEFEMWLVGDGPLRKSLQEYPAPPNVKLRFFGNVPYHETHTFYSRAGIFVLPTLCDTWGLAINEALGSGLPILGSRYSQAVEELVTNGWNGWTFRADHPEELRAGLAAAMTCTSVDLSEMSNRARLAVRDLTPERSASGFLQAVEIAHASARARRSSP